MDGNIIHKAGALLVKDRKVLLNRQGGSDVYIVPGGQLEAGETPVQALIRELKEEFLIETTENNLEFVGAFDSPAVHHPGKTVRIETFIVKDWKGDISINNEIEGVIWTDSGDLKIIATSPFTQNVAIPLLVKKGLID